MARFCGRFDVGPAENLCLASSTTKVNMINLHISES